jgi:hypothetical protein
MISREWDSKTALSYVEIVRKLYIHSTGRFSASGNDPRSDTEFNNAGSYSPACNTNLLVKKLWV